MCLCSKRARLVVASVRAGEQCAQHTIAVGNARNDVEMLAAADLVFAHIDDALDSLLNPKRLVATLRD